jgi:DnaA family protein
LSQLALPLSLDDYAVFDTFWPSGNEALIAFLEDLCAESSGPGCWIWGKPATGKSHLLQAVCERMGDRSVFLPLKELSAIGPGILDGVAERRFVCLDDVHTVAGQTDWERALFHLFNSAAESDARLVVSSHAPPRDSGIALPDLQSRFSLLPIFQLHALDEEGRRAALKLRARHRGLDLPDKTARYLTQRSRRDMGSLYELLDRLDSQALVAQRRLTIPFVKSILE